MKMTFISPFPDLTAFGIRAITSYIEEKGHTSQIIFLPDPEFEDKYAGTPYRYEDSTLDQVVHLARGYDIIGISFFTCYFERAVQLTQRLKEELNIPIIWGGKHPSAMPEEGLRYADMVCVGEGEEAVNELLNKMANGDNLYDTENIWFRSGDRIIKNKLRPLIQNLDAIPISDYSSPNHYVWNKEENKFRPVDNVILKKFFPKSPFLSGKSVYLTMTTRGCPWNCTYCFTFKDMYKGQKYLRRYSFNRIMYELKGVKERYPFVDTVVISDDEFLASSTEYIKEFARLYKEEVGLYLSCLAHPQNVTEEKISAMVAAGLKSIQIGIETASDRTRKLYKRIQSDESVLKAAGIINKFKGRLVPCYDFIIDNPYETNQDIVDTLKFIIKLPKPYLIDIFSLVIFPGTKLYEKAVQDKIIDNNSDNYRTSMFRIYERRYLNMIFFLFNYPVPKFVIRFLINKYMVFLLERKSFNKMLSKVIDILRHLKLLKKIKLKMTAANLKSFLSDLAKS